MLFICIIFLFLSPGYYSSTEKPRFARIIGGHRVPIATHPYQVILYIDKKFECSGSIISKLWVVTAGHCIYDREAQDLIIRAGSSNRYRGGELYRASFQIIHPGYDKNKFDNDFALIKVKRPFNFANEYIKPVKLASVEPKAQKQLYVSGWGSTGWMSLQNTGDPSPFYSTYLMEVDVFVVSRSACEKTYKYINEITPSMLCASGPGKDACAKDSGGPLVDAEQNTLVGVVSWGAGCAYSLYPGVYANIAYGREWIYTVAGV